MKASILARIYWVLAALATAVIPVSAARACAIDVTVPDQLVAISPADPRAKLAFRSAKGGFPTFNLVCNVGPFPARSAASGDITAAVIQQYRAIGLVDVRLERHAVDGNGPIHDLTVSYSLRERHYHAHIAIVSSSSEHAIATFVAEADDTSAAEIYKTMRSSMRHVGVDAALVPRTDSIATAYGPLAVILTCMATIAIAIAARRYLKTPR